MIACGQKISFLFAVSLHFKTPLNFIVCHQQYYSLLATGGNSWIVCVHPPSHSARTARHGTHSSRLPLTQPAKVLHPLATVLNPPLSIPCTHSLTLTHLYPLPHSLALVFTPSFPSPWNPLHHSPVHVLTFLHSWATVPTPSFHILYVHFCVP